MTEPLLSIRDLRVEFGGGRDLLLRRRRSFEALGGIDVAVEAGEIHAIVGESGAGKSTAARCVLGLQRPTSGEIRFEGRPLGAKRNRAERRAIQMVFQDPISSLNPRMKVGKAIAELLNLHDLTRGGKETRKRAAELFEMVGLPESALDRRPAAFSGGQRQRIGIARALAVEPTLLVADEPVASLDVSIQASILVLLKELQAELGLTILFISHDLAVVRQLCDHVAVMGAGKVVEQGTAAAVFSDPKEDLTRQLLAASTDLPPLEIPRTRQPAVRPSVAGLNEGPYSG